MNITLKNYFLLLIMALAFCACNDDNTLTQRQPDAMGSFVDARDGFTYHYVRYGNLEWTIENAHYLIPDDLLCTIYQPVEYSWNDPIDSTYYDQFGCLYSYEGALQSAPEGWRVPTDDDWKALERHFGMSVSDADGLDWRGGIASMLMERSNTYNTMSILMGGYNTDYVVGGRTGWKYLGVYAYYWTATTDSERGSYAFARKLCYNQAGVWRRSMEKTHYQLSVRFVRDAK